MQSALLEAMQEKQVTIGDKTFPLPELFLVLATQNPIEQEGTYPLPEAQVDRFMLKVIITYPSSEEERTMLDCVTMPTRTSTSPVTDAEHILASRTVVDSIYIDDKIKDYIVSLVCASRDPSNSGSISPTILKAVPHPVRPSTSKRSPAASPTSRAGDTSHPMM